MEELSDSFGDLRRTDVEMVSNEKPRSEGSVHDPETNIEQLILELTGGISQTNASGSAFGSNESHTGGGVMLTDPTNFDEILTVDEALIPPTSHNVSVLNVACQQVLKQMEYQLLALLKKNRKEQEIIQSYLDTSFKSSSFDTSKTYSLKCAGMPFFKDHHGFQPPPNEDVLIKQKNNTLLPVDFIRNYPKWNGTDSEKLIEAVKKFDVAKPSAIDWLKISVRDMQGKYSASECKAKWMMHLNPSINRSKWTLKEMSSLKELSARYNYQNWDKVAAELGTDRTGLQCCVRYHTHTLPTVGKWTKEEDDNLKNLVEKYRVKDYIPWKKVAWHFEDRSLRQCQERYAYHLANIKRGNFTMEEDFVIVGLASKLKNFGEVAKFIPHRVATQLRARYEYLVAISMPQFSQEEDELLSMLMVKYPRNWGKISEHFKNRSRIQCRRRWAYLQRKIHLADQDVDDDEYEESVCGTLSTGTNPVDAEILKKNIPSVSEPMRGERKYPDAYKKLLDYHKICHKFLFGPKPRINQNSEDLKKLTTKMAITMETLSVAQPRPLGGFNVASLSNNCEFDKEDLLVLNGLSSNEEHTGGFELSTEIIPPNYMTLVALRTFTLGWGFIQNLCSSHTGVPVFEANEIEPEDRLLCSDAKKLFKKRMKSIFAFPLILSNISAIEARTPFRKPKCRKGKPLSRRKRKEHAKLMSSAYRNKLKTIIGDLDDSSDVACAAEETEVVESNKNETKSKRAKKGKKIEKTAKPENGKETANKKTKKIKEPAESVENDKGNNKNTENPEHGEAFGSRKRTRSAKIENNEFVAPLKKRALRNTTGSTTNGET